jgi:hypothetical protein
LRRRPEEGHAASQAVAAAEALTLQEAGRHGRSHLFPVRSSRYALTRHSPIVIAGLDPAMTGKTSRPSNDGAALTKHSEKCWFPVFRLDNRILFVL